MNQIEIQRQLRDEAIYVRQMQQIKGGIWQQRFEESQRFLKAQLAREVQHCKEISVLRAALIDANAKASKWESRVNQLLQGEINNG